MDHVVAEGGMGVVVAATHLTLEQPVALKFMLPDACAQPDAVARFEAEARAVARLKSAHVSRVLDVAETDDGAPYIVMEYLEGSDLGAVIGERAPLPPAEAVEYLLQACDAIAEAHSLGIVHRDLKPENVFLTRHPDGSPWIKVLDFGISKSCASAAGGRRRTTTREVMGSPAYMSPEQLLSTRDVDGRTDIWSLGVLLYELLAGRPAFDGETIPQVCVKVMQQEPAPLRELRPEIPEGLALAVERCLMKDRAARFGDVGELARALQPFASRRAEALVERIGTIAAAEGPLSTPPFGERSSTAPTSKTTVTVAGLPARRWWPAPLALAALLGAAGAALFVADGVPASGAAGFRPAGATGAPTRIAPPPPPRAPVALAPTAAAQPAAITPPPSAPPRAASPPPAPAPTADATPTGAAAADRAAADPAPAPKPRAAPVRRGRPRPAPALAEPAREHDVFSTRE